MRATKNLLVIASKFAVFKKSNNSNKFASTINIYIIKQIEGKLKVGKRDAFSKRSTSYSIHVRSFQEKATTTTDPQVESPNSLIKTNRRKINLRGYKKETSRRSTICNN